MAKITDKETATKMAQNVLKKVENCSENGLPKCYKDIESWLADFYPDLPWDSGAIHSYEYLLNDPSALEILKKFSQKMSFDMVQELNRAKANVQELHS